METSTPPHRSSPRNISTVNTNKWIDNAFLAGHNSRLAGAPAAVQDVTPKKPGRGRGKRQIEGIKKLSESATSTGDQDVLTGKTNARSDEQYDSMTSATNQKVHFGNLIINYRFPNL